MPEITAFREVIESLRPEGMDPEELEAVRAARELLKAPREDREEAGPPEQATLSDQRCLAYYKHYNSNWFTLKGALRTGGDKPDWPVTPEIMWDLWLYRKKTVDGTINRLREDYPTLIAKSVGSKDLESDYDLTVATPGSGGDIEAVTKFNKIIKDKMGNPPGIVFDTNLYVKDYVAVTENINQTNENEDTPLDSPGESFSASDRVDQDVAAIMKQRRYMEVEDYDAYLTELTAGLPEEQQRKTRQQYEEAESIYQLALAEQIERAQSHPLMQEALGDWELKAAKIEERREALNEELERVGSFAALDEETKAAYAILNEEQAAVEFEMKKAVADLEHANEALFLEMNNEIYLEKMAEVRRIQDLIRAEAAEPDENRLQELRESLETLKRDRAAKEEQFNAQITDIENEEIVDEVDLKAAKEDKKKTLAAFDRKKLEIEALIEAIATDIPDEPRMEALKAQVKKLMGTAIFFSNEAYHSQGAVEHIVAGIQGSEEEKRQALAALTPEKLLQSFNEQLGDFFKDLGHYADKPDGEIFYRSSKYLVRLLGAVGLLQEKLAGLEPSITLTLAWGDANAKRAAVESLLYPLRKAADMEEDLRCKAAVGEVRRIFGVADQTGLKNTITALSTELNREVRKSVDFSVDIEETRSYHRERA